MMLCSVSMASDINIQLSEKAINSFVTAATPWKFNKEVKILDQKTMAEYNIKNVVVSLKENQIYVEGKLNLNLNGSKLEANINGELKPILNNKTGILSLKLAKVNIVGLEFLKLDRALKDRVLIPLELGNLKPIKIKKSEDEYQEIYPKITNENIIVGEKQITVTGDISFEKGEVVIKEETK